MIFQINVAQLHWPPECLISQSLTPVPLHGCKDSLGGWSLTVLHSGAITFPPAELFSPALICSQADLALLMCHIPSTVQQQSGCCSFNGCCTFQLRNTYYTDDLWHWNPPLKWFPKLIQAMTPSLEPSCTLLLTFLFNLRSFSQFSVLQADFNSMCQFCSFSAAQTLTSIPQQGQILLEQ